MGMLEGQIEGCKLTVRRYSTFMHYNLPSFLSRFVGSLLIPQILMLWFCCSFSVAFVNNSKGLSSFNSFIYTLVVIAIISAIICFISNPGIINDRREGEDRTGTCEFCDAIIRVRSRHCALPQDDSCVNCFHKHSLLMNKCIGWNNHRSYFTLILCLSLLYLYFSLSSFLKLFFMTRFQSTVGQILLLCIVSSLNSLSLLGCLKDEFSCVLLNLTFHELNNMTRLVYLQNLNGRYENPFDKGKINNILEFLHLKGIDWGRTAFHSILEIPNYKYKSQIQQRMEEDRRIEETKATWKRPKLVKCSKCNEKINIPDNGVMYFTCPLCGNLLILQTLKDISDEV